MNSKIIFLFLIIAATACSKTDSYNANTYYSSHEQEEILTSIIAYIFDAPPYTAMKDRFNSEHRNYYKEITTRFLLDKYYVNSEGLNYFYVLRPAAKTGEYRGVGGYFTVGKNYTLLNFREIYVTPILSLQDVKTRGEFLFDKMVKGEIKEFLKMKSYVQWPNDASYYDTVKYEWVPDPTKFRN